MRVTTFTTGVAVLVLTAGCSPGQGSSGSGSFGPTAPGTPAGSGVRAACQDVGTVGEPREIPIESTDDEFSTDLLTGPSHCQPFVLVFTNNDPILHNVGISTEKLGQGEFLLYGDKITGPETFRYEVAGIPAGEYFFVCTLHWQSMNGGLIVAAAD